MMNRNQFSPPSFAPLNVAFLLLLILTVSLASRPLAAKPLLAPHTIFLPIVSIPEELDEPTVGYATGTDRTLIRWFCSSECDTDYEVYRRTNGGAYQLLATVGRETNSAAAILTLNTTDPRWTDLYDELLDIYAEEAITDMASLYGLLDENKLIAQKLTNEYYPVALINGWGYLDTDFVAGTTYEYRVVRTADDHTLGEVKLVAGQITPLPAPQNVQALQLDPEAANDLTHAKADDWGRVQADRRFHHTAYLKWDVGNPAATSFPSAWTIGYDIYRAPADNSEPLTQVNGEISVQPLPASAPDMANSDMVLETAAENDYQLIEHFYADQTAEHGDYLYRVAPRDALAQVREWPEHTAQFSAAVPVTTYDFLPPLPPQNPQAVVNASHTAVTLSWEMPDPPADLAGFRIERTLNFHNDIPTAECGDEALCWLEVATVGTNTFQWIDNDPDLEQARWYRLQAVDESGNRSMYTMPVHATLHDITPPGPPLLSSFPCGATPSAPNPPFCLVADGDEDDVTRYLVGCTFSPDSDEIYLVERAAENGDMPAFAVTDLYEPPFPLENVACTVRAVDEMGNISEPSAPAVIDEWTSEQAPELPTPIITSITTIALEETGEATAAVKWEMPASPLIASFSLERVRIASTGNVTETINGIGPAVRTYNDIQVFAGELYQYTITAVLKFGLADLPSEPRFYNALNNGRRPLVRFDLTNISWSGNGGGTTLTWNSCPVGSPVDGQFHYAVFRSTTLDEGYTQVTPIISISTCAPTYVDASAQHGRYFYAIMEFDGRTGEPIGYTIPAQFDDSGDIQTGGYIPVVGNDGLVQSTLYNPGAPLFIPNCTPINPIGNDFTQPLVLGDGFELHNLVLNPWVGNNISGFGDLRVVNNGVAVFVPTMFSNITVADAQNRVCTGQVHTNIIANTGEPIVVTPEVGLAYEVAEITARPFFASFNEGTGKVRLLMPNSLRVVDENGEQLDSLNLAGLDLRINANLDFSFQANLDNIANHGCAAGEDPIVAFSLETMPTIVVPTGILSASPAGVEMAGSCMDYDERYNPVYAAGNPRPPASNLNAGDSNDGFLRGRYTGIVSTQINATGLAGIFLSNAPMSYVASYPFGFSLELNDTKSLVLADSHISTGSLGAGTAVFEYIPSFAPTTQPQVKVNFSDLIVDERGGLYATVTPETAAVEWLLPNGFVTGLLHSELYLGAVTSNQRPGQTIDEIATSALWATRPGDQIELGLENPATLEPGLNIRREEHGLFWKTCPTGLANMPAIVDSYIRHGGLSERFQAQIETPFVANIHGYEAVIDNFDLSFLDNYIYASHITGDVDLPFPADLNLRFISMWFGLDGCIGGGELLNGFENIAYWDVNVNFNHAVFADEGVLPLPGWTRVLRTIGALELPHVSLPNQPAPTLLGVQVGFRPDGQPYGDVILDENRPDFELDGFPLLLTGLRLSNQGEAADWDANATAATPPNITDWDQMGFVELHGAISAPYFGLLVRETGAPGDYPHIQMQLHNDYVGFDEQLKGARVWVDLPIVQVVHEYENLVYASSELEGHGLLLGWRHYEFVPQVAIDLLGLPDSAKVIQFDATVIMEPEHVHFFIGQSAGTAAFRAMAEAIGGANPTYPGEVLTNLWAGKLNMNPPLIVDEYQAVAEMVWPTFDEFADPDFRITTAVLNEYDRQPNQSLPTNDDYVVDVIRGTIGAVGEIGVDLHKLRGHIEVDGLGLGMQLEMFHIVAAIEVQYEDEPHPILTGDMVSFMISRYGDYILEGVDVGSRLVRNDLSLDLTGLYNPNTQAIEAGLGLHKDINLVHDLEMWSISLNELTGAVGLGGDENGGTVLRYIGLNLEASWNFVPFKAGAFGGQILAGTIDPSSPVLNNHFPDVLEHLHIVPAAPGENEAATLLKGAYIRLYGDTTQGDAGVAKVYTINGGVRYGGWYWSQQGGDDQYFGAIFGTFVHMNYLKVFSARGDLTFTYEATPEVLQITAEAWLAAGIGSCEPETWTSWEGRWWNDKWCWTGGVTQAWTYDYLAQDFDVVMQFDVE